MIKPSNTIPTKRIMVLTCCSSSGRARVDKTLRPYHPRVIITEKLNKPRGTGYTVTVWATPEAVVWVEYLLVHAGYPLLSAPYDPANAKYVVERSLEALKGAHERMHQGMPMAWENPKYKPPEHSHEKSKQPTKRKPTRKSGKLNDFLKDWL